MVYMVIIFGFLTITALIVFGWRKLPRRWNDAVCICTAEQEGPCTKIVSGKALQEIYSDFFLRRNEFWQGLGQFVIVIVLITLLTVLLLAGKITQEAALPVMAGLGSFAVGKGITAFSNGNSSGNMPVNPEEQQKLQKE